MSKTLLDLPNELLFQVLDRLENRDINALFGVPLIRGRIERFFCLVSDVEHGHSWHLPEIPARRLEDVVRDGHRGYLFVVLEINDISKSGRLVSQVSDVVDHKISVFDQCVQGRTFQNEDGECSWFGLLGKRTKAVSFEMVERLTLSDLVIDPSIFHFPKLETLRLARCDSDNLKSRFDVPNLKHLHIEGFLNTINECIGYSNHEKLDTIMLTEIEDIQYWSNIENYSVKEILIKECDSLVKFSNLMFHNLTKLTIKDSDIREISFLNCPNLQLLHVEQFMQSIVSIHDLNLPSLKEFLLWVFKVENIYNVNIPSVEKASIMLSNEPIEYNNNQRIDLSCFKSLKSFQLCLAIEILRHVDALEELEIRGPVNNELLFQLQFNDLKALHINFNNSLTEVPKINAPKLQCLTLSRCISIYSINDSNFPYRSIEKLYINYSGVCQISNISLANLKALSYMSSTSQPLIMESCDFPKLKTMEITNLEIKSDRSSRFQLIAPSLISLKITNFRINQLTISGDEFPFLVRLTITGGLESLKLIHCSNLRDLDISNNRLTDLIIEGELSLLSSLKCLSTNILDFEVNAPLLKRTVYDEMITFVRIPH